MSDEKKKSISAGWALAVVPVIAPLCGVVFVVSALLDAWVARQVWLWTLAPYLHIPTPSYALFVGADAMLGLYVKSRRGSVTAVSGADVVHQAITYPLALLCGVFILTHWIGIR